MKTKNISLIATLVALIITFSNPSFGLAQVVPTEPGGGGGSGGGTSTSPADITVIQSQDLVRDLGLRTVRRGSIYYSSPSIDWNYAGTQTGTNVTGKYAEDVFAQLAAFQYNIRLKNPNDEITVYAYGDDGKVTTLFGGQARFKVGEKPKIQMNQWWLPLLSNVSAAEVIPIKEDGTSGQPITMNINEQGQLLFQPYLSGAPNGLLAVKFKDGSLVTYRLAKPIGETPVPVGGIVGIGIQDHYVFLGKDAPVIDIIALWQKPTALFECTQGSVPFDVRGVVQLPDGSTMLERPSGMTLTDENGNNAFQYKLSTTGVSNIELLGGKYRVRSFDWNLFAQPNLLYSGPTDGGGKGRPEASAVEVVEAVSQQ
ncbi:MAG TPA: hypothetical protein VJI33_04595 [Candidatus Paceibacterota bacterium]